MSLPNEYLTPLIKFITDYTEISEISLTEFVTLCIRFLFGTVSDQQRW